ncbi:hypothetical protein WH7805_13103 [Synechococcus sp. WH 7805]|uniref:hypothetical protein n=1 Tax=Synechococcus sp. WH 8017 TaxID=166321 RepID=UPI00006BB333|nr:hypothetical protein WH7805_13103 [Synechococcus sp. WH 7805]
MAAVLDQAETDFLLLMSSGLPEKVAAAFGILLRLLFCSSKRLQAGMALDQHVDDSKVMCQSNVSTKQC